MKIDIFLERTNENKVVNAKTIPEIFEKLKLNPHTIIIVKNNELVTEDEPLREKDKIKLLSVISGG
ncbi:MAG: MoaD/ThiS family protein [Nanoarchaeota archaeon]